MGKYSRTFCVLVARSFNRIYELKMNVRGEMDMAYRGEINTPSRCGRMDQCCAFGRRIVAMTFDANTLLTREVDLKTDIYLILVDLKGQKNTKKILEELHRCFPEAQTNIAQGVHKMLGSLNQDIFNQALLALENTHDDKKGSTSTQLTAAKLGSLMNTAQRYFDEYAIPACPQELTAPLLHKVLEYLPIQSYIFGGKGVGSQGDGSAQFVCKDAMCQKKVMEILEFDLNLSCLPITLQPKSDALFNTL